MAYQLDADGNYIGWVDAEGVVHEMDPSETSQSTDNEEVNTTETIRYSITNIEQDKENNCIYMTIKSESTEYVLTRYNEAE